jgi:hypothetical protein
LAGSQTHAVSSGGLIGNFITASLGVYFLYFGIALMSPLQKG